MSHTLSRRAFGIVSLAAITSVANGAFAQTALPKGPITLVVPFAAGGATDIVSRHVAKKLTDLIGQSVIVENVAGAGGAIGAQRVAKSAPNGQTLLMGTVSTHAINPLIQKTPTYDPVKDFTPISNLAIVPNVLLVANSVPAKTARELIDLIKANPTKYNYGSSGVGTPLHLSGELFKNMAGVQMDHIAYRGGAPAMNDLVAGQIPLMFDVLTGAASFIKAGSIRALGVSTKTRSPAFPDIPTLDEAGLPGFETYTWNAIFGPAGMPADVTKALSDALQKVISDKDIQQKLLELSATPVGSDPASLAAHVLAEQAKWKPIVDKIGLKID